MDSDDTEIVEVTYRDVKYKFFNPKVDHLVDFGNKLADSKIIVASLDSSKPKDQGKNSEPVKVEQPSKNTVTQIGIIRDLILNDGFFDSNYHTSAEAHQLLKQRGHNMTPLRVSTYLGRIYRDENLLDKKTLKGKASYKRKVTEQNKQEPGLNQSQPPMASETGQKSPS